MKYFGLPLGGNPLSMEFWMPMIEKVSKRLDGWKNSFLSKGGRLTLIQSVLASIPIYYMSLFKIPNSVVEVLERVMRTFLWDNQDGSKSKSLVAWDIVMSKQKGGFGIRNLKMKKIYGYRMSLWAEHLGTIEDCFIQPESLDCVRRVRSMGEKNWKQFAAEEVTEMRGHLLKYPVEVDRKGKVKPLSGNESFPDVGGNIIGSFIAIQENLTI
ncbi:hypothetical protein L484_020789 [Morus notabilis]|uniref:Phospholipase D C-terminal domain-containing protein n=1 Tax=Morus notabilis TaxID=981085 RepID=W9S352_9ROSA|nr:hypothetical protein L484_020789 [Morus notabilis]